MIEILEKRGGMSLTACHGSWAHKKILAIPQTRLLKKDADLSKALLFLGERECWLLAVLASPNAALDPFVRHTNRPNLNHEERLRLYEDIIHHNKDLIQKIRPVEAELLKVVSGFRKFQREWVSRVKAYNGLDRQAYQQEYSSFPQQFFAAMNPERLENSGKTWFSDWKQVKVLVRTLSSLMAWNNHLGQAKKELDKKNGFLRTLGVKSLLFDAKSQALKTHRWSNSDFALYGMRNLFALAQKSESPESCILEMKRKIGVYRQEIFDREKALQSYGYLAGVASGVFRLCTGTFYGSIGKLLAQKAVEIGGPCCQRHSRRMTQIAIPMAVPLLISLEYAHMRYFGRVPISSISSAAQTMLSNVGGLVDWGEAHGFDRWRTLTLVRSLQTLLEAALHVGLQGYFFGWDPHRLTMGLYLHFGTKGIVAISNHLPGKLVEGVVPSWTATSKQLATAVATLGLYRLSQGIAELGTGYLEAAIKKTCLTAPINLVENAALCHRFQTCCESQAREILGVSSGASSWEIKQAYRKMALATHPDKMASNHAFEQVGSAFKVLRKSPDMGNSSLLS